jgi:hypothetical protein
VTTVIKAAAGVVVVVVACAGLAVTDPFHRNSGSTGVDSVAPTSLASITRGPLTARTSATGALAYAGSYQIIGHSSGTYTTLPKVGRIVHQGRVLYRVDGKPVIFLVGRVPLYRDLKWGLKGTDVRQLNHALVALGYAKAATLEPTSPTFGRVTAIALERLQKHLGVTRNGVLTTDQAVFLPRATIRITKVDAAIGAQAGSGSPVAQASSIERRATVALDASLQSKVKIGDDVTITLPDLDSTPGVVTSVGTVAKATSGGGATVQVTVRPTDPRAAGNLDQAPVGVSIVTDSVKHVLTVPVNALLALLDGQFGVETVDASGIHHLVPVTLGLFDDTAGTVRVTGAGLAAGQRVVVPSS